MPMPICPYMYIYIYLYLLKKRTIVPKSLKTAWE